MIKKALAFLLICLFVSAHSYELVTNGDTIFPVSCDLNVLIILDRSDSVRGGFERGRQFVIDISRELNVGPDAHRVALIAYSGTHYRPEIHRWNFAKNNEEFISVLHNLRNVGGTTNTNLALEQALELMESRNQSIPTLVMVVTDGLSQQDPTWPAARLRAIPQTWVFAAATGDPKRVNRNELLSIGGLPTHVITHSAYETAESITRRLFSEAQRKCRRTTTTTTTTMSPFTGCEQDLVLVFDFSTSTLGVFREYMVLAEQLIRQLFISPRHTRVALITFSSVENTHTKFNLSDYNNADDVIRAIRVAQWTGGTTAVGIGIREAMKQAEVARGARPGLANKIMVIFTDGWSYKGPNPDEQARLAQELGFRILSVAVRNPRPEALPINRQILKMITGEQFSSEEFDRLIEIIRERNLRCIRENIL